MQSGCLYRSHFKKNINRSELYYTNQPQPFMQSRLKGFLEPTSTTMTYIYIYIYQQIVPTLQWHKNHCAHKHKTCKEYKDSTTNTKNKHVLGCLLVQVLLLNVVSLQDVKYLLSQLPNVIKHQQIPQWDHLDFVWGMDAPRLIYHPIINMMKRDIAGAPV